MYRPHWVMRTVKAGRVKVLYHWYRPDDDFMPYDGRFDGKRFLFGLYWNGDIQQPFLALWGSERYAKAEDSESPYGEDTVVDGHIPWYFWGLSCDSTPIPIAAKVVLQNDAYWHPEWLDAPRSGWDWVMWPDVGLGCRRQEQ